MQVFISLCSPNVLYNSWLWLVFRWPCCCGWKILFVTISLCFARSDSRSVVASTSLFSAHVVNVIVLRGSTLDQQVSTLSISVAQHVESLPLVQLSLTRFRMKTTGCALLRLYFLASSVRRDRHFWRGCPSLKQRPLTFSYDDMSITSFYSFLLVVIAKNVGILCFFLYFVAAVVVALSAGGILFLN